MKFVRFEFSGLKGDCYGPKYCEIMWKLMRWGASLADLDVRLGVCQRSSRSKKSNVPSYISWFKVLSTRQSSNLIFVSVMDAGLGDKIDRKDGLIKPSTPHHVRQKDGFLHNQDFFRI